jgi:hypothetical protein
LQDEYRERRDSLPENLAGSATAAALEAICDLDGRAADDCLGASGKRFAARVVADA